MKIMKLVVLSFFFCFTLLGSAVNSYASVSEETITYPATVVGKEVIIDLPANYTAGYDWKLITPDEHMEFIKQEYQEQEEEIGSGGIDHWHFRTVQSGTAKLVFEYSQPWEKENKHLLTVIIPINP